MKRMGILLVIVLAVTGCGTAGGRTNYAGAQTHGDAANSRENAASPSVRSPASRPVWLDSVQMMSAAAGWALISTENPNYSAALDIARTSDGGHTWEVVTPHSASAALSPGQTLLYAVSVERAWVVGVKGPSSVVFGTVDGGQFWWRSLPIAAAEPVAVAFAGARHGWLLESMGAAMSENPVRLYRSSDGGRSWSLAARSAAKPGDPLNGSGLPVACDKTGAAASPATPGSQVGIGWITSYCPASLTNAVLVSRDGGAHWTSLRLPLPASLCEQNGCEVAEPQFAGRTTFLVIWAFPDQALLLATTDGGATWRIVILPDGAGPYPRVRFFGTSSGIAVSAGAQGTIGRTFYLTSDGGRTWTPVAQGRRFGSSTSFDFVSSAIGCAWVTNEAPVMYQTSSSGRSWTSFVPRLG
jgi:photosystem II stability/assembly factor-like uncharacterized protein